MSLPSNAASHLRGGECATCRACIVGHRDAPKPWFCIPCERDEEVRLDERTRIINFISEECGRGTRIFDILTKLKGLEDEVPK